MLTLVEEMVGAYRTSLLALVGAVLAVLVLASANVSALQLVRATTREHELVVRLALGASRADLARVLELASGLLVAAGVARVLGTEISAQLGTPVWVAAPLCLALAGLAAELVPARRALRLDLVRVLVAGRGRSRSSRERGTRPTS